MGKWKWHLSREVGGRQKTTTTEEDAIPQIILPVIPAGSTQINDIVNVQNTGKQWIYSIGIMPFTSHDVDDRKYFMMTIAQLIDNGACSQAEIVKAFGVSKRSVIRAAKQLRTEGVRSFFAGRKGGRSGAILTRKVLTQAQAMLDQGNGKRKVASELGVSFDTFRKALEDGRLIERKFSVGVTSDKSSRSLEAVEAADGMGTACTRVVERMLAAVGKLCGGARMRFEESRDVSYGGVLCALPGLLANGLLSKSQELLGKVKGYYTVVHVLLVLSYLALARIRTVEDSRGKPPADLGRLIGLDRSPEARCLRRKMDELSGGEKAEEWSAHLSREWMSNELSAIGRLYVDSHVRVYHGSATQLPRHYVSRERLCLRGTTDYWINDAKGLPFFVVEHVVDPGLLEVLRTDIVPRLLKEVPKQPSEQELAVNPWLCRFVLVFDREGYSPAFFKEMWQKYRIACITYHKHPKDLWIGEEFRETSVKMSNGETVSMKLAERGSLIGTDEDKVWVREIRKLSDKGHQTSLIATEFQVPMAAVAGGMFSRWCQENFFGYMMQHFAIDLLAEHGTEPLSGATKVVNPVWRQMTSRRQSIQSKLIYRQAKFAAITMKPADEHDQKDYQQWLNKKATLLEEIQSMEKDISSIKSEMKQTPKRIEWLNLPETEKFNRLLPGRKRLFDTIRMIAYRAETAMIPLLKCDTLDSSEVRALLQDLFLADADLSPDYTTKRLHIRVHRAARPVVDQHLERLFVSLNETATTYPGTDLQLIYEFSPTKRAKLENGANTISER